jgi:two-component system CheB/CheR fusion protein
MHPVRQLFEHLPEVKGMACIVIQCSDLHCPGSLPALLSCITKTPVSEGQDRMCVLPNQVYVIVPGTDLMLEHACFKLQTQLVYCKQHLLMKTLFCSLTREYKQCTVGLLLSGTHAGGEAGLQAIKAVGSITFVQDIPASHYGQPQHNALVAECAGYTSPPEEIAREPAHLLAPHSRTGVDFLSYKPAILKRRIRCRMAVVYLEYLVDYADYLDAHQYEVETLYQNVFLTITDFFRDPVGFDALCCLPFPEMVERCISRTLIRIWVPGCSTGKEACSLVVYLIEFVEEHSLSLLMQIFATDVSTNPSVQARPGFTRKACLPLSHHSVWRISSLYLTGCRESTALQKQSANGIFLPGIIWLEIRCFLILAWPTVAIFSSIWGNCSNKKRFVPSILSGSTLFSLAWNIGNVALLSQLFMRREWFQKLCRKRVAPGSLLVYPVLGRGREAWRFSKEGVLLMPEETSKGFNLQQEADRLLLTNYAPASVVVDTAMEILHVRGRTGPYLELAPGKASVNLLKMARPGLTSCLRAVLHTALKENRTVIKESVQVNDGSIIREVRITVRPLKGPASEIYFLVLFEEMALFSVHTAASFHNESARHSRRRGSVARRIMTLEQDLAFTRAEMQVVFEERDAVNKELHVANEERQSVNEELQDMNEELETSREELQATNQELITANQELEALNEQLREAQGYAEAIVETMREALLVLDAELRIQRANTAFYLLFRGTPPEVEGQYFFELGESQWSIPQLRTLLEKVLVANQSFFDFRVESNFPTIGQKVMLLNGRRIQRTGQQPQKQLILLAIEDITKREERKAGWNL